jgi:hypothetical protein
VNVTNPPAGPPRFRPDWLALREEADAAARSPALAGAAGHRLAGAGRLVIIDLGCGTGAMGRWLARRLPGRQHWVLCDRDPGLLAQAAATMTATAADGSPVTVAARRCEVRSLTALDLAGASLVTASALLDLLTRDEVDRLAAACAGAGCPALFTLSVTGRIELIPADPLDQAIASAFNDHQRRRAGAGRLLGPDAVDATTEAFTRRGARVRVEPSPWRLGPDRTALTGAWLRGWVAAACEQRPGLAGAAPGYLDRRLAAVAAGALRVVVEHRDLLAAWLDGPTGQLRPGPAPNRSESA